MVVTPRRRYWVIPTVLVCGFALLIPLGAGTPAAAAAGVASCPDPVVSGTTATVTCSFVGVQQDWDVPRGVDSVTISASGAQGGSRPFAPGGKGAQVQTTFPVTTGLTLHVVVGGTGPKAGSGGGGGSFVWILSHPSLSDLILAAAGGGGSTSSDGIAGSAGTMATDGKATPVGGVGGKAGTDGDGGGGGSGKLRFGGGGGGGGLWSDGQTSPDPFGGGGGGSGGGGGGGSYIASGGSHSSGMSGANAGDGTVTITYSLPSPGAQ